MLKKKQTSKNITIPYQLIPHITIKTKQEQMSSSSLYKISQPESFRNNIRQSLGQLLFTNHDDTASIEEEEEKDHTLIQNLERGIYNYAIKQAQKRNIIRKWENPNFVFLYIDRLRSVYLNLKTKEELVQRLKSGQVLPQQVAFMTHQEFAPQRWYRMMEEKAKREASKYNTEIQASTDVYQCKRCKSRKCIYSEQQVRSADESMTIFVTCLDCGKQWKC